MHKLIERWDIILQTKEAHDNDIAPGLVGSQMSSEPDIREGFLIVRNGNDVHGVPMDCIHSFSIVAIECK